MSNYYEPYFYRIGFDVIPSYIELPCTLENDKIFKFLKTIFLDTFISEENDGVLYFFKKN